MYNHHGGDGNKGKYIPNGYIALTASRVPVEEWLVRFDLGVSR